MPSPLNSVNESFNNVVIEDIFNGKILLFSLFIMCQISCLMFCMDKFKYIFI